MSSTTDSTTQLSAGRYPHPYGSTPLSPAASSTLVNVTHRTNWSRPSIKLKIPGGASDILNSVVVDTAGESLFSISSTSKHTVFVSSRGNVKVATVEWDRSSPRIIFRQRKVKCKEWLPRAAPETESRVLTQGDAQFIWMNQSTSGYIIPANRHGLGVARWHINSNSDELHLQIFQEALVESGLLEAIVLSLVLLRSGRSLGDTLEGLCWQDPSVNGLRPLGAMPVPSLSVVRVLPP
ncbi:hypothetical protein BC827DRAFT_1262916 [Russula dissimulans]|nr:hypothetical protein BC827DRAFT_1262916 [Russula dissimulans]